MVGASGLGMGPGKQEADNTAGGKLLFCEASLNEENDIKMCVHSAVLGYRR